MHLSDTIPEEWRPVIGYEGWYSVSNLGHLRRDRNGTRTHAGRLMPGTMSSDGYIVVGLCTGTHATLRPWRLHRLVAVAFLGPPPDGHNVNHLNGLKTDNRVANLEWATPGENSRHAARLGLLATGERHGSRTQPERTLRGEDHPLRRRPERAARGEAVSTARLTADDVRAIRASPLLQRELAARYSVAQSTISWIRRGVTWRHIPH